MNYRAIVLLVVAGAIAAGCSGGSKSAIPVAQLEASRHAQSPLAAYEADARQKPQHSPPRLNQRIAALEYGVNIPASVVDAAHLRQTRSQVAVDYRVVAVLPSAPSAYVRSTLSLAYCYYLVTISTDMSTGDSWISNVEFLGCDGGGGDAGSSDAGGSGGAAPPPPNTTPGCTDQNRTTGSALNTVNQQRPDVFLAPNPNGPAPNGIEAYGWVYSDGNGGFIYTNPQYGNLNANRSLDLVSPPDYSATGYTAVGVYHTHPYDPDAVASQTQAETGSHFSPSDTKYARDNHLTMYVGVQAALDDQHPNTSALRWYSFNPTTGAETMQGLVGGSRC